MSTARSHAPCFRPARAGSTLARTSRRPTRSFKHAVLTRAGLFDVFSGSKTAVVKAAPKAQQKVEELLELVEGTTAGLKISPADKEAVEELVRELEGLSIRAPAKSPLLSGVWEVIYKTSPDGLGNPLLRNPLGQAALKDQTYYQVLDTDGELRNVIQYKTLGLLPGEVNQGGAWEVTGPNTIKFTFKTAERELEVVYLDEQLRITKLVKDDGEDTYIVFRRVEEEEEAQEEEDVEEEEEEVQEAPKKGSPFGSFMGAKRQQAVQEEEEEEAPKKGSLFGGLLGPKVPQEGLATRAERSVQRQAGSQSTRGTMQIGLGRGSGTQRVAQGTQSVKADPRSARPDPAAAAEARKAEAERRRREVEEAAERRREEAEARKQEAAQAAARRKEEAEAKRLAALEAAEAKKREAEEARQRQLEIREFLAELRDEAKEAQTKSRAATAELKAFEKQAVAALRDSSKAAALIQNAQERSSAVEEQLLAARGQQAELAQGVKAAQQDVREAEKAFATVLRN